MREGKSQKGDFQPFLSITLDKFFDKIMILFHLPLGDFSFLSQDHLHFTKKLKTPKAEITRGFSFFIKLGYVTGLKSKHHCLKQ